VRVEEVLLKLLEQYTPSGEEHKLAPIMRNLSDRLRYRSFEIDSAGNYIMRRGRGSTTLLLAGHVDTVPGEVEYGLAGGKVYGRGSVDAKGPLAALLVGGAESDFDEEAFTLVVAGLVDEEGAGRGAQALLGSLRGVDGVVIGEPTGGDGIVISYRGSLTVKIYCSARGGHSSAPYVGESALDKLLELLSEIRASFNGKSYGEPTSAVTQIRAGDWPTKLPEQAEATVNIRYPPGMDGAFVLERIEAAASLRGCGIEVIDQTPPVSSDLSSPLVRSLVRSILMNGRRPRVLRKTGSSDMNILYRLARNIAAYGPGNSLLAHTAHESVEVEDLEFSARVVKKAVEEFFRMRRS
jgi:LysW-gamma-L-lysine carboxypeptidase